MGIFINTNIAALNAQRNLGIAGLKMSKALERLSSGLRINRAADDAAGLSISEGLRSQIRGMRQASRNAQDAISMVQTAEGALNEVHGILQRMRELTVQAGNTTVSTNDRIAIGEEMLTLKSEIDNIASRTTFNGLSLLTGALSVSTASTITDIAEGNNGNDVVSVAIDVSKANAGTTYTITNAGADITVTNDTTNVAQTITVAGFTTGVVGDSELLDFSALGVKLTATLSTVGGDGTFAASEIATGIVADSPIVTAAGSGNATFRVGAEIGDNITVSFDDMQSSAIGSGGSNDIGDLVTDNTSVDTVTKADTLLTAVDDAITDVSTTRAKLGAAQNQVETAVASLGVGIENLAASESRIRDADIAEVSTELVTRQIMQQAGVAVLAQANTASQSVLSLLQ